MSTETFVNNPRVLSLNDWLNNNSSLSEVELLARLIIGEETSEAGMRGVAKVLQNRYVSEKFIPRKPVPGHDQVSHGSLLYGDISLEAPWHWLVNHRNNNGGYSFSPLDPNKDTPSQCLNPLDEGLELWHYAIDLARLLQSDTYIVDSGVASSFFFNGLRGIMREHNCSANEAGIRFANAYADDTWEKDGSGNYIYYQVGESIFYSEGNASNNMADFYAITDDDGNSGVLRVPDEVAIPYTGYDNNTGIPYQSAAEFIDFLKSRVGCGYVLGTYGQICTSQLLQNRAVADPENGASYYVGACSRWLGKLVADCSGLIEWFLLKKGVTNCDSYSGGMYKNWCSERSAVISEMPKIPGVAVFKRNSNGIFHVGIYIGRDRVIEAKGAMFGVVVSRFSTDPGWNAWGILDWLNYDAFEFDAELLPIIDDALTSGPLSGYPDISTDSSEAVSHNGSYSGPLYKKGDTGPKIEMIRRRFWATNSSFPVNEFFDDSLENKIIEFQTANFLTVDGKVGSHTWRKLFPILQKKTGSQFGAREMQALLNYQNYPVGTPDGLFGSGTENVLKAYQVARQLDPDGICGDKTWESLTLEDPFLNEVIIDQNGDYTAICKMGDSNDKVVQLQRRLAQEYNLVVTGNYDSMTNLCIIAYQNANGITANGNCGPITWSKLFPVLRIGRGQKDEVRPLQMLLTYQKHGVLIDGIFGTGSDSAVKAYQTMRNLTADGIVGEQTWASLTCALPMPGVYLYFGTGGSGNGNGSGSSLYCLGDNKTGVRQIKRRMSAENLFSGVVNTIFDSDLDYSIKSYQADQGVRIDGIVGPATWSLLFPIVKKQTGQQSGAKAVQTLLNLNGFSVGTPDGLFGTGSETKLIAFQAAHGLTPDGLCGAKTWAKLCEI